ncbi:hypothetical protein EGP98_02165, partial [bacterium]|nr:hypothetical protein [bacterium]
VAMAGALSYKSNINNYLCTGATQWTMTPIIFAFHSLSIYNLSVDNDGSLTFEYAVPGAIGVRPVINLKADILITKGDGTALSPFVIES